ncbi:MAG TPA: hypothetical protein VEG62_00610, partial [Acidimicrobiales bacterium]|nr:hypothetical protein [Acidimicrobiales bacterium]
MRGFVASVALVVVTGTLGAGIATAGAVSPTTVPQVNSARAAAQWLAGQFTSSGYIANISGSPNYSSTVNGLLALAAANVDLPLARTGLSYVESNVDAYAANVDVTGEDGPGQLALLILLAHAFGVDPTSFGGTNLVQRLLATEQTSGANDGLFGSDTQLTDGYVGGYVQGLALVALKAAGATTPAAAVSWLEQQQCPGPDGGWSYGDQALDGCTVDPTTYQGPDTNSTSLALQGLEAQGALGATAESNALGFLQAGQDADGGWSFFPSSAGSPQTTDPDSTSLVIQALLALGRSPDATPFDLGNGDNPTSALLSFQIATGPDAGGLFYPGSGSTTSGDVLATYQAVPALMGLPFGFGPQAIPYGSYLLASATGGVYTYGAAAFGGALTSTPAHPVVGIAATRDGGGYWLVASDGGVFAFGNATFEGSMGGKPLNKPVVGIASMPDGGGYWLVASDGGIFAFGDAGFYGSMGGKPLNKPVVGIASTPDGGGYWLVASDGGIFAFGDAGFYGSMGGKPLNKPVVGIAST